MPSLCATTPPAESPCPPQKPQRVKCLAGSVLIFCFIKGGWREEGTVTLDPFFFLANKPQRKYNSEDYGHTTYHARSFQGGDVGVKTC